MTRTRHNEREWAIIAAWALLLAFVTITSCKKDNSLKPEQGDSASNVVPAGSITLRDGSAPAVVNGILTFASYGDAKKFAASLQEDETDQTKINAAYAQLGIDVNGQAIPNLTDNPVCLVAEQSLGFTSARKIEENAINALLNQGDDNVFSIVHDPYWKTLLNADHAVRMGNRIYRYFEDGGIAIVLNNDLTLFDAIKQKKFDELEAAFNLVVTDESQEGWSDFFVLDVDGNVISEKPMNKLRFGVDLDGNGNKLVRNISLVEPATTNGSVTYTWKYANTTTFTGSNPNKSFAPNEAFILTVGNGAGTTDVSEATVLACSVEDFSIIYMGGNSVKFSLAAYNPATSAYNIAWEFSDGQTGTGGTVTKTFTSSGTATCKAYLKNNGTLACQFTKPFQLKCGDKKTKSITKIYDNYGGCGQKWKLDCTLWVQTGQVGCMMKYRRMVGLVWVIALNEAVCTDVAGKYKREVTSPSYSCSDKTANKTECLGEGTFPGSITATISEINSVFAKVDNNFLNSGHKIKVNGVWFGPGVDAEPRLVLN